MKNEGLLSLLSAVLKKNTELPEDVIFLMKNIKELTDRIKDISGALAIIATTLKQHSIAIEELYSAYETLMKKEATKGNSSKIPPFHRLKSEKPN